jgi:hypothetical protein
MSDDGNELLPSDDVEEDAESCVVNCASQETTYIEESNRDAAGDVSSGNRTELSSSLLHDTGDEGLLPSHAKSSKWCEKGIDWVGCLESLRMWLPAELKDEYSDVLIFFVDADRKVAVELQQKINTLVVGKDPEKGAIKAKAVLCEDAALRISSHVEWLELALHLSTYFFVIFTEDFLREYPLTVTAHAAFWASVVEKSKQGCFVPVYLKSDDCQMAPMHIRTLKGLQFTEGWHNKVEEMIDMRINVRVKLEEEQEKKRWDYLWKEHNDKVRKFSARCDESKSLVNGDTFDSTEVQCWVNSCGASDSGFGTRCSPVPTADESHASRNTWDEDNIQPDQSNPCSSEGPLVIRNDSMCQRNNVAKLESAKVVDNKPRYPRFTSSTFVLSASLGLIFIAALIGLRLKK